MNLPDPKQASGYRVPSPIWRPDDEDMVLVTGVSRCICMHGIGPNGISIREQSA